MTPKISPAHNTRFSIMAAARPPRWISSSSLKHRKAKLKKLKDYEKNILMKKIKRNENI